MADHYEAVSKFTLLMIGTAIGAAVIIFGDACWNSTCFGLWEAL